MQKFLEIMKQVSINAVNSTSPMQMVLAEVTQAAPNLQIKLDINEKLVIDKDMIVVAEHLTPHKRKVTVNFDTGTVASVSSSSISSSMTSAGYTPHTHNITSLTLNNANVTITDGYLNYEDDLKVGEIVIVAIFSGGQRFLIIDRAYIPQ